MKIDPAQLSGSEAYRLMISAVVPRPIAFISSCDEDRNTNLAPFSYFNCVTSKPPLISVSIGQRKWGGERIKKDTLRNIEAVEEFVVNIATMPLIAKVNASSAEYPPGVSEIEAVGLTAEPSERVSVPRIAESPINLECRLHRVMMLGDAPQTGLIIGEVVYVHVDDSVWNAESGEVDPVRLSPLARLGGSLYGALGDITSIPRPKLP